VASVKLNPNCGPQRPIGVRPSPGRLDWACVSLRRLVSMAYGGFADGAPRPVRPEVGGGESWVDSELYDIEAKASGPASFEQVRGVMLQRLLEERFKVEVRSEFRELAVYLLTVAKSGSRLQAAKVGGCIPEDPYGGPPNLRPGAPFHCGMPRSHSAPEGMV